MKIHELKTDPNVFAISFSGIKPWEIRKNDRNFKVGDLLILKETISTGEEMKNGAPLIYTGRILSRLINYILDGNIYGLEANWVIMTVSNI